MSGSAAPLVDVARTRRILAPLCQAARVAAGEYVRTRLDVAGVEASEAASCWLAIVCRRLHGQMGRLLLAGLALTDFATDERHLALLEAAVAAFAEGLDGEGRTAAVEALIQAAWQVALDGERIP